MLGLQVLLSMGDGYCFPLPGALRAACSAVQQAGTWCSPVGAEHGGFLFKALEMGCKHIPGSLGQIWSSPDGGADAQQLPSS